MNPPASPSRVNAVNDLSDRSEWIDWSPEQAPHVRGRYQARVWNAEEGMHEEQRVEATCSFAGCGAVFKRACTSGRVRELITTFATVHLHRDPFSPKP